MRETEEFLSLLACQRDLLLRLLDLTKDEHESLVHGKPELLDAITQEKTRLFTAQAKLSEHVTTAMMRIVGDGSLDPSTLTLSRVLEYLDASAAEAVRALAKELFELEERLQREGRINYVLAQQSLRYIDYTLRIVSQDMDDPLPYHPTQSTTNKPVRLLMDTSA